MEERVQDLLAHLTLAEKIGLLSTHQLPIPRLDIGEWYIGTEVARGYMYNVFPLNTNCSSENSS